jgi:allene oxide cyclase
VILVSARKLDVGRGLKEGEVVRPGRPGKALRVLAFIGAAALAVGLACGCGGSLGGSSAGSSDGGSTRTIHVIEHADTDTTIDVGKKGDSTGDILTFHNKVFDKQDKKSVGTDLGRCIRVEAGKSYECAWTTSLHDGQITVDGPFYDDRDSVLAITGGTGAYKRARGEMRLRSRKGGTEFDFVFKLAG